MLAVENLLAAIHQLDQQNALAQLGLIVQNGVAQLQEVIAGKVTTQTAKIEKIEMVDKATGEVWCTWIENGEWKRFKGECSSSAASEPFPQSNSSVLTVPVTNDQVQSSNDQTVTPTPSPEIVAPLPNESPNPSPEVSVMPEPSPAPPEAAENNSPPASAESPVVEPLPVPATELVPAE